MWPVRSFSIFVLNSLLVATIPPSFSHLLYLHFISKDNKFLDWFDRSTESAHPVFGKVIENYALVERISQVPTNEDDCPTTPIQMIRVTIV